MSYRGTIIDESVRCMDDECPQRASCRRWTTGEEQRGGVYAGSLRPRWQPATGDCINRIADDARDNETLHSGEDPHV